MRFSSFCMVLAGLVLSSTPVPAQDARTAAALESAYFAQLDHWVGAGGPVAGLQSEVVETCGKLVMLMATRGEQSAFVSTDRAEFDLRLDVCTKMTMHRVQAQEELLRPGVVPLICDRGNPLFVRLCERSGLR